MLPPGSSPTLMTPAKRAASPLLIPMDVNSDSNSDTTATGFILHGSPVRQMGRQKWPSLKATEEIEKQKD